MAVLDTLEIILEADSRGLDAQLRKGSDEIVRFVNQMNSQEVNWQKILAGSLDTAIISGIASTFAIAISQAVQFQGSMLNISNNTQGVASMMSGAAGNISDALVNLTGKTGSSLATTASAYQAFYKQFGDAAAAQELTAEAGALAEASQQKLTDLMPVLIDLFNQWGVTTLPQAEAAMTGLVNSAGQGKFSLNELINIISKQGPILQGKTNIADVANQLQALSNISGLAKNTIVESFGAISNAVANPLSTMDLLVGNMSKKISGPDGLINAFASLSSYIKDAGAVGATFGQQMGISLSASKNLADQSRKSFADAASAAGQAKSSWQPFWDIIDSHLSTWNKFQNNIAVLMGLLTKDIGFPALEKINTILDDINSIILDIDGKNWPKLMKDFGMISSQVATGPIGNAALAASGNSLQGALMSGIWSAISPILASTPIAGMLGLNGNSQPVTQTNAPASNNKTNNMGAVTINQTVNVTGNASTAHITGKGASESLYNSFMGLLSNVHF